MPAWVPRASSFAEDMFAVCPKPVQLLATDRSEPVELRRYVAASVHCEVGDGL